MSKSKSVYINKNYIYQKADYYPYHCASFALYNFLLNYNIYIGLNKLINLCKPDPIKGTNNKQMNFAIEHLNKKFSINIKEIQPTLLNINNILKNNGKIIILFHWTHHYYNGEHYAVIETMINNEYKFINYSFDEPIKIVSLRELKAILIPHILDDEICPTIWSMV